MAPFLRKRLQCFYCGRHSSRSAKGAVREWTCDNCQAANYLDENGEIMDPPVADSSPSGFSPRTRYAVPVTNPQPEPSLPPLFCSTCLKNQQILTQTLASYLPPPSHPEYDAYEASYPAYRKSLEERYPQVCEGCEPRIRERIRQAGYVAKADHLRRMMERSREARTGRKTRLWKSRGLLVFAGAMAFWASVAGQLAWNVMGALSVEDVSFGTEVDVSSPPAMSPLSSIRPCVSYALRYSRMPSDCETVLQPYAGLALTLGALSVWWNPKLRHKAAGRAGRLKGLREYYQIQIIVLVMRFAAWAFLQDDLLIAKLDPKLPSAVHLLVGVFTLISVFASRSAIKYDTTPLVRWQEDVAPLIQKSQRKPEQQQISPPNSQGTVSNGPSGLRRFPISSLAIPKQPSPEPFAPLTPPEETMGDEDAMDWTPSQQEFRPNISQSPAPTRTPGPPISSLFRGQLPPAPKPPAWHLRNRNPEPAVKAIESQPNPFHNAPVLQPSSSFRSSQESTSNGGEMVLAPAKFFPPSELTTDTGLERLFDRTFSLADEPDEVRRKGRAQHKQGLQVIPSKRLPQVLKCVLLTVTLIMMGTTQAASVPRNTVETVLLAACFLIAGFSLLESLMRPMAFWSVLDFLLPLVELTACGYLTALRSRGSYNEMVFDRVGKGLTAFMLVQEMMALRSAFVSGAPSSLPQLAANTRQVRKPDPDAASQQTFAPQNRMASPRRPQTQFGAKSPNNKPFSSNNRGSDYSVSALNQSQSVPRFSSQNSASFTLGISQTQLSQNQHFGGINLPISSQSQTIPYPPPFSSFSRPPTDPSLSFSSFGSAALPEKVLSTASTVSTADDDGSSTESELPSPRPRVMRQRTPYSATGRRSARSPSMTGLTLDDSPICQGPSRYSLRNRR